MADQKVNELPAKASPVTGDKMLVVGAAEESLIDYDQLADAILNKLTSKTFTLDQGTKSLVAALNELNSKTDTMNLRDANDGFYNGSSYQKDFMYISTSDRYGILNKAAYFLKPADPTDWINIPTGMPRNTDVYGIREVIYCYSNLIFVKITEIYPVSGRQYFNAYRGSEHTWGTWYIITPQA